MDVGAPAVVAAIHDAVGVWIHELPASPERILGGLGMTAPPNGSSAEPAEIDKVDAAVAASIEAGTDPRPDAPTDPQVVRGPRDPDEPR